MKKKVEVGVRKRRGIGLNGAAFAVVGFSMFKHGKSANQFDVIDPCIPKADT